MYSREENQNLLKQKRGVRFGKNPQKIVLPSKARFLRQKKRINPCKSKVYPLSCYGGEQGIRTLETALTVYTISSRAPSTSSDNSPRRLSIIHNRGGKIKCFCRFFSFSCVSFLYSSPAETIGSVRERNAASFLRKKQPPLLRQPFHFLFFCPIRRSAQALP